MWTTAQSHAKCSNHCPAFHKYTTATHISTVSPNKPRRTFVKNLIGDCQHPIQTISSQIIRSVVISHDVTFDPVKSHRRHRATHRHQRLQIILHLRHRHASATGGRPSWSSTLYRSTTSAAWSRMGQRRQACRKSEGPGNVGTGYTSRSGKYCTCRGNGHLLSDHQNSFSSCACVTISRSLSSGE